MNETPSLKKRIGRILAVDYGHVRMGLALSDPLGITGQSLETIGSDKKPQRAAKKLCEQILILEKKYGTIIDTIVLGLPLHMNGSESIRSQEVRAMLDEVQKMFPEKSLRLLDERLTSFQAERAMKDVGQLSRKERAGRVDSISALILLQCYLDSLPSQSM